MNSTPNAKPTESDNVLIVSADEGLAEQIAKAKSVISHSVIWRLDHQWYPDRRLSSAEEIRAVYASNASATEQEQELQPTRAPVDIYIVDHVEPPIPN